MLISKHLGFAVARGKKFWPNWSEYIALAEVRDGQFIYPRDHGVKDRVLPAEWKVTGQDLKLCSAAQSPSGGLLACTPAGDDGDRENKPRELSSQSIAAQSDIPGARPIVTSMSGPDPSLKPIE